MIQFLSMRFREKCLGRLPFSELKGNGFPCNSLSSSHFVLVAVWNVVNAWTWDSQLGVQKK